MNSTIIKKVVVYLKNFNISFLIILGIAILTLVGYWFYSIVAEKEVSIIKEASNLEVTENHTKFIYMHTSNHFLGWNYSYKIVDECLYVTIYYLRMLNPIAIYGPREVEIDKGYDDFNKIYVNGQGEHKLLIWTKSGE